MQEQKYRYFIDGKEVDNRTDYLNATMSGDYVSYFDGDSVFSVSFNSFFGENTDNNKIIKREVNGHVSDAINSRLQLSKKINEEALEKYKSLFKPIDQTQYNTLDLGQIKGSSTRHKSQNGEAHKEVVGDLEGINKPPKTEQLNYQSFYQVVYTKPTSNWNKFEIAFSDNDLEKIKDLSIGDIKEMFNSTISAEKTEKEEFLIDDYPLGYKDISKFAVIELERKNKLHCIPTDATNIEVFHLDTKDNGDKTAFIGFKIKNGNFSFVEVPFTSLKIAKKENKTEENSVFQKDSEIHKEELKPDFSFTGTPKEINDAVNDAVNEGVNEGVKRNNEGVKESNGKTDYSEINLEILDLMAERFTANKHKYPQGNMKKPIDIKSLEWALFRHVKKMIQPIETDEETYKDHLSAVLCNASMLLDQLKNQK